MRGHQKKRSSLSEIPLIAASSPGHISSFSTASSLSRPPLPGRIGAAVGLGAARGKSVSNGGVQRELDASPPASSYFTRPGTVTTVDGVEADPVPAPGEDVASHFSFSTTLRRHSGHAHGAGDSLLPVHASSSSKLVAIDESWTDGAGPSGVAEPQQETPASVFARCSVEETASHFRSSPTTGLSSTSIPPLRQHYGYNEFTVPTPPSLLLKFAQTIYESPLILLLCGSAAVSAVMGNVDDAVSITVAILIVLTVGFVQERRSEKSLEALGKLVPHYCHLTRYVRFCLLMSFSMVCRRVTAERALRSLYRVVEDLSSRIL